METKRNILKEYEEMTSAEKAQVDAIVNQYKDDSVMPQSYQMQCVEEDEFGNETRTVRDIHTDSRITGDMIENYMSRLAPHIAKVNEKVDNSERSKNEQQNAMRMQLFEDRWKKGFYNENNQPMNQAPVNVNVNTNSDEVKQLKQEISDLKKGMNDMIELLKEKLK